MRYALITGANSGLGFETALQLGREGTFDRIVLACRTLAKADIAKAQLVTLCGCPPERFDVMVVDVSSVESTRAAMEKWAGDASGLQFELVVLNAGRVGGPLLEHSPDGLEISYAASLAGHYVMAMRLLKDDLLTENAALVIAGAEAARGTLPGMTLYDIWAISEAEYDGDLVRGMTALARGEAPNAYHARSNLATLKAFAQWWGAGLARRLDELERPVRVFVVSPGGVPATKGVDYLPFMMRTFVRLATPLLVAAGQAHSIEKGAARYLEMLDRPASDSGKFFASADGKHVGPLVDNTPLYDHFHNADLQDAALATLESLTHESML